MPPAETLKVAVFPAMTLAAAGGVVMDGASGVVWPVMVMVMFWESAALPGLPPVTVNGYDPAVVGVP